ncbi:MAG: CubicO group peptidase (beta-lactamase class C family) [Psychroserpens sp.]|jgi:CubicO group peptidase (beta-lactamase class C family)
MKRPALVTTLLFLVILQSCSDPYFKQNLKVKKSLNGFNEKVDSIVIHKMNEYNIPGLSIGLVSNDSIIYTKGYGVRNIETNTPVSEHTIFHTASISKLFTSSAIIKLINDGLLSLDDKLYEIIPELQFKDERIKKISIKDLLNHTSGLPDIGNYHWENNNQSNTSLKEYILSLNLTLESAPSLNYSYSNLGYNLLGYVIEKKTKSSFENYLKNEILIPSGMIFSDFRYFNIHDSLRTSPHTKNRISGNVYKRDTYPYTREHAASSTLNASVIELSKWMIHFLKESKRNIPENNYALTLKPTSVKFSRIGLGYQQYGFDSKHAIGHYAGDKGFRSFLMMIPEENIGLVVLGNCDYEEDFRQEIIYPIVKLMLTKNKRP